MYTTDNKNEESEDAAQTNTRIRPEISIESRFSVIVPMAALKELFKTGYDGLVSGFANDMFIK